jgi:hypothetical protein
MHFTKSDVSDPVTSGKTLRDAGDLLKKLDIAGLEARQMLFKNLGGECDSEEIHHMIARIFPGSRPTDEIYIKALEKVTRVFNDCRKQTLTAADDFQRHKGLPKLTTKDVPLRSIVKFPRQRARLILDLNGQNDYAVEGITEDREDSATSDSGYNDESIHTQDDNIEDDDDSGYDSG